MPFATLCKTVATEYDSCVHNLIKNLSMFTMKRAMFKTETNLAQVFCRKKVAGETRSIDL